MGSLPVSNDIQFLREFLARPRQIASPIPSGRKLAQRIAEQIDPGAGGTVLELGPGTGAVTCAIRDRGISDFELIAIESDRRFVRLLRRQMPGVRIIEGDAFGFVRLLGDEANGLRGIVSGLPVLGRPRDARTQFLADAIAALKPGCPFIQFSYSPRPPIPPTAGVDVRRAAIVWLNLPPMHIWTYRSARTRA
jgi:phosphatidylethanolamine/phosphatidyl-N-methylethanolamine N-methyltransferase